MSRPDACGWQEVSTRSARRDHERPARSISPCPRRAGKGCEMLGRGTEASASGMRRSSAPRGSVVRSRTPATTDAGTPSSVAASLAELRLGPLRVDGDGRDVVHDAGLLQPHGLHWRRRVVRRSRRTARPDWLGGCGRECHVAERDAAAGPGASAVDPAGSLLCRRLSLGSSQHRVRDRGAHGGRVLRGSIMWNQSAAAGAPMGWVCTASGTPGTWRAMAAL